MGSTNWGGGGVCTPKPVTRTLMVQSLEGTASSSLLALCEPMLTCVWVVYRYNEWCEVVEVVVKQRITPPWDQRARGHFTSRVSSTNPPPTAPSYIPETKILSAPEVNVATSFLHPCRVQYPVMQLIIGGVIEKMSLLVVLYDELILLIKNSNHGQ